MKKTQKVSLKDLEPCPFCGFDECWFEFDDEEHSLRIECPECKAQSCRIYFHHMSIEENVWDEVKDKLKDKWNNRV